MQGLGNVFVGSRRRRPGGKARMVRTLPDAPWCTMSSCLFGSLRIADKLCYRYYNKITFIVRNSLLTGMLSRRILIRY